MKSSTSSVVIFCVGAMTMMMPLLSPLLLLSTGPQVEATLTFTLVTKVNVDKPRSLSEVIEHCAAAEILQSTISEVARKFRIYTVPSADADAVLTAHYNTYVELGQNCNDKVSLEKVKLLLSDYLKSKEIRTTTVTTAEYAEGKLGHVLLAIDDWVKTNLRTADLNTLPASLESNYPAEAAASAKERAEKALNHLKTKKREQ